MNHSSKIVLFFLMVFVPQLAAGQRPLIQWSHFYGGSGDDYLVHMITTSDSGYLLGGATYSNDSDCVGSHGDRDYLVVKVDSTGKKEWSRVFGGSGLDGVNAIAETQNGYYVIGYTYSNNGDFASNHGPSGVSDFGILKLDRSGNKVWAKCYGGSNYDEGNAIIATTDGGFAFVGNSRSNNGDIQDHHNGTDAWFAKCDSSGKIEFSISLGGSGDDEGHWILETKSGFLVSGITKSKDGNVPNQYGGADAFVALIDKSGIVWYKIIGGSGDESAPHGCFDIDGLPIYAAATSSKDHDCTDYHGGADGLVFKLDLNGNLLWAHCVGTTQDEAFAEICSDSNFIYAVGGTHANIPTYHGANDFWVAQLDHLGHTKALWAYGGSADDGGCEAKISPDGYLVLAGNTKSMDGDISTTLAGTNMWLFKLACSEGFASVSPTTLFASTTAMCDTISSYVRIRSGGCSPPALSSTTIVGPGANNYKVGTIIGDSLPFWLIPQRNGLQTASAVLSFTDGTYDTVALTGYTYFRQALALQSLNVSTDTIGGTVYIPISINGLTQTENVNLTLHYPTDIKYLGTFDTADNLIGQNDWLGRSQFSLQNVRSDKIAAWAEFQVFTDSNPVENVTFDSVLVMNPEASCLYELPQPITVTITPPSGCGSQILSNFIQNKPLHLIIYPNPVSGLASIHLSCPARGYAEISIVNLLGVEVARIFSGELDAGEHSFTWESQAKACATPGMYECVVRMNGKVETLPVMVLQ